MHPAAPDDRNGLIDAFDNTVRSIIDLGYSCRDEDFDLETECPGWTVKDQIAHIVGAEKSFAGLPRPQLTVPDYPHLRSDFARFVEVDVEARRGVTGRDVVAELAEFHPGRVAELRASDADVDTVIGGFFGPDTTFGQHLHRRIVDAWVHEQDLRAALDRPGNLDSASAAVFTADILAALPRIAARVAGIGAGHAVVLDVTGPVVARDGVRISAGEDGKPYGEALFSGQDRPEGDEQLDVTSVHLTTDALTRRAAGRRPVEQIRYTVTGDEEIARRLLDALVVVTH
ncbi:hypothetical protein LQK93_02154 [Terrabacter sp. BE26]